MSSTVSINIAIVDAPNVESIGPTIPWVIADAFGCSRTAKLAPSLSANSPQSLDLGGITPNLIVIEASSKIDVALTCADGTAQVVSVDTWMALASRSVPYTAITLTGLAGVTTEVAILIGQI